MIVPSGRQLDKADLQFIRAMHKHSSVRLLDQPRTFRTMSSRVEIRFRNEMTESGYYRQLCGRMIVRHIERLFGKNPLPLDKKPCLIGVPTVGNALAAAAAHESLSRAVTIGYRTMRERKDRHGRWVEGEPNSHHIYGAIDNALTSGESLLDHRERLSEDGYAGSEMFWIIVVDREQGGYERLKGCGFPPIIPMYYLSDILYVFGETKLWTHGQTEIAREDIAQNQLSTL